MPACESVKAVKTPIAYSGMSASTRPRNATTSTIETMARATIPALNASRSPRYANWRGMKPSRARIEATRGKSAKLVWAARTRIPIVESCSTYQIGPGPNMARPICERTDSPLAAGSAPVTWARKDVPRNIVPSRTDMMSIVVRAFCHSGGLKAGTPLATASVPVMAEQPSANARIRRSSPNVSAGTWTGITPVTCGGDAKHRSRHADHHQQDDADRGRCRSARAKIVPLSRMPRRFTTMTSRIAATMSGTVRSWRAGNAEARLNTPLDTLTATVST